MKLIDKSAVLAIIEKELSYYKDLEDREIISDCGIACYRVVKMLKSDIESLEVKEVDLEREINDYFITVDLCEGEKITENTFRRIAKRFFELGMAVSNKEQKGE